MVTSSVADWCGRASLVLSHIYGVAVVGDAPNSLLAMRVVAGELKGRKIQAPEGKTTRPTTDMAREATFNALGSLNVVVGARVVDAFAGSGALGIEAISRGAAHCTFIERDRAAVEVLRENLETLGIADRATVIRGDVMTSLRNVTDATLLLADPPYDFTAWQELLDATLANLVVAESDRELGGVDAPFAGWTQVRVKRYGRAFVTFLQR